MNQPLANCYRLKNVPNRLADIGEILGNLLQLYLNLKLHRFFDRQIGITWCCKVTSIIVLNYITVLSDEAKLDIEGI